MNPLEQHILDRINKEGPISFESFMEMALYYPELGYYSNPDTKIGKDGDFYTSPHLHPVFGAMIGKQLMEMWTAMGRPPEFHAVEIGAGVGYLSHDIIKFLGQTSDDPSLQNDKRDFLDSLEYIIIEPFDHFARQQQGLLDSLINTDNPSCLLTKADRKNIRWEKSLNDLNNKITGCIFSNELLDAFPVRLIEMSSDLHEVCVNHDGDNFCEELREVASEDISSYITQFSISLMQGYRTEINLRIKNWLNEIDKLLVNGFILTIDYGYSAKEYYDEDRSKGTLLCYHNHLFNENPYQHVGRQDITAHVNFSSLKLWGEELGIKTVGYCAQGTYLISGGIDEVIADLYANSPDYLSEVSKIKGLIMPQGMGESHSVLIQYKGEVMPELRGFSMKNLKRIL